MGVGFEDGIGGRRRFVVELGGGDVEAERRGAIAGQTPAGGREDVVGVPSFAQRTGIRIQGVWIEGGIL